MRANDEQTSLASGKPAILVPIVGKYHWGVVKPYEAKLNNTKGAYITGCVNSRVTSAPSSQCITQYEMAADNLACIKNKITQ